jgi:hypothetical protein
MTNDDLVELIQRDAGALVEEFLPSGAQAVLTGMLSSRRDDVNPDDFLMFAAVRELLRRRGKGQFESNLAAGEIMSLLRR